MSRTLSVSKQKIIRATAHRQLNLSKAKYVGVYSCGKVFPIMFQYKRCGKKFNAVIFAGPREYCGVPYKDSGEKRTCCKRVLKFNFEHILKCKGNPRRNSKGGISIPEYEVCCDHQNQAMKFPCGHYLSFGHEHKWRQDKFIYMSKKTLQNKNKLTIFSEVGKC